MGKGQVRDQTGRDGELDNFPYVGGEGLGGKGKGEVRELYGWGTGCLRDYKAF